MTTLVVARQSSTDALEKFLLGFVVLAALLVIGHRLYLSAILPLWLDETWSAMISSQGSWATFWHEAWLDCNPPLYYIFLNLWMNLFGDSNLTLRIPSFLFSCAAAFIPLLWQPKGLSKNAAYVFAGLMLLWPPNLFVVTDARGYGLMLFLSVLSSLTVAHLLENLTLRLAAAWVALGTLMFMTHYFAATLLLGQAIILLCRHRLAMLRMWPAAFIAAPGLAWFASHLPRLKDYARPDVTWYDPTNFGTVLQHLTYVLGITNFIALAAVILLIGLMLYQNRLGQRDDGIIGTAGEKALALSAYAAILGFVIAVIIGLLQDSLADRYFVPFVPSAMLGLTLIIQRCPKQRLLALMLMFVFLLPVLNPRDTEGLSRARSAYGYEEASSFVMGYQPDELVFLWDHPAAKILEKGSLEGIGSYFLKRSGYSVPVTAIVAPEKADANALLRAEFTGKRPAFIWLYDTGRRSAAGHVMPNFHKDPQWTCRYRHKITGKNMGLGTMACVKLEKSND